MPFTFSHPAIVLPLTLLPRRWFSLTGLFIGSLTPDFEYFLRMRIKSNYSHTLEGLFWFDLPLGLLLAFLFHKIVKNKLIENLPAFLKSRFLVFRMFEWNQYFKLNWKSVITSILIGAASHLFWDSFTHETGFFVELIPVLQQSVNFLGVTIPILKILQHSSSLVGGIVLGIVIFKLPTNKCENQKINTIYWGVFAGLTVVIVCVRLLSGLELNQYGNFIVTVISAVLMALIITPWFTRTNLE